MTSGKNPSGVLWLWISGCLCACAVWKVWSWLGKKEEKCSSPLLPMEGMLGVIGKTPLIRIGSLSEATKCEIWAKAEFLNPGGSIKDRVALGMVQEGLGSGTLKPGGLITEGTVGSTGVSLALVARAVGCRCHVVMPDDAAVEKVHMLEALGATVERVRPVSITHPDHFVNVARRRAKEEMEKGCNGAMFADQFENPANYRAQRNTGEEIWEQSKGQVDAFVCGAGTGGTIAGVSNVLKRKNARVKIYLSDPPGSGLYNKVTQGVMYTREEAEGKRLRNPCDTITEGVGLNRQTANFKLAHIDEAFRCSDREAVEMSAFLVRNDGLFLGSSSAVNCVGAVKAARKLGAGARIVTILCDGGHRHMSRFHSQEYLKNEGLLPRSEGTTLDFLES